MFLRVCGPGGPSLYPGPAGRLGESEAFGTDASRGSRAFNYAPTYRAGAVACARGWPGPTGAGRRAALVAENAAASTITPIDV